MTTTFGLPQGTRLAKAHGTGNTFIFFDDVDGQNLIKPEQIAALCSQTHGIGADGLIRVTKHDGYWFMDYRNADGSTAEMCGNGIRAFVNHLRLRGFITLNQGEGIEVLTRGGVRLVTLTQNEQGEEIYSVNMGKAKTNRREDTMIHMPGLWDAHPAIDVAMPNPHCVIDVKTVEALEQALLANCDPEVAAAPLRPSVDPKPENGTNIELTVDETTPEDRAAGVGRLRMRVLERGVGETASCGTGCCAAAVAAHIRAGSSSPRRWVITLPGGEVIVDLGEKDGDDVILSGPATHVADIVL